MLLRDPLALIPEGEQKIVLVPFVEGIDASVELSVFGTSLGTRNISTTARWETSLTPGDYELTANVQCGGGSWLKSWALHVYPRKLLTNSLPRECRRLLPMSGGFDCDGVAVDFAGAVRRNFASGVTSRVFPTADGGWGRWVATDGGLLREVDGVDTNTVPFPDTDVLVATESFCLTPGQLVLVEDGGLRAVAFDAGLDVDEFFPCAASESAIAWCFKPFAIFDTPRTDVPWYVCSLSGGCTLGGKALFVMQDLRTHVVTFRNDIGFFQASLDRPHEIVAQRLSRPDEISSEVGSFHSGDGEQGRMQQTGGLAFGFLADGLETFTVPERLPVANSEFVWIADAGVTSYARLR